MGIYQDKVLPRVIDRLLDVPELAEVRARVASPLRGSVLEVGFGSGLNVPHYPPAVTRLLAVDPSALGRKLAAGRIARRHLEVDFVGPDAQSLPLPTDSVDHVLITWTLCTIPTPESALAEIYRVLRPGGALHFAEHGRSPEPLVARWQDRLTPLQRRIAGGCHLNRQIDGLIEASGLEITSMKTSYMRGPKAYTYTFEGIATKPVDR